ncbi:hypothetical protein GCM10022225_65660 [Plantactinospora mayteni]|uniref:WXG100 family type VII secretion target n=1 Tax=Plantactinospora mayteni TaxID=566021 RepID=A0ABQ4EPR0_9ACTN|nr:hypothetical protein [Plantactinospora mayteni]GIG96653.1 hypothetical protein Pma05_32260 [Plantactinospora mayteni]
MSNPGEPQGSASEHTSAIERAVNQIRENITKIVEKVNAGIDNANSGWFWLSPAVKLWITRSIDKLNEALDKILKHAREVLAHYTPVLSLVNISFHWLDAVKKPVSNMSSEVQRSANANLAYWEGGTASYYKEEVKPPQKDAVDALAAKAGFISEWLYGIAMSNVTFVTELSTVIGTILGEITAAALESATIINIPWAIDRLAAAVGALVETAVNTLLSIAKRIVEAGENVRKTVSDRVDYGKFPSGAWPQAVKG